MNPLGSWFLGIVRAFAEALFDEGQGVPKDRLDWLVEDYADYSAYFGAKTRVALRLALIAVQLLPFFFIGVPLPMTRLGLARRRHYLDKVERSGISFLITAVKAPVAMIYFEHPDALAQTGYDGESLSGADDPQRAERAPAKAGLVPLAAGGSR